MKHESVNGRLLNVRWFSAAERETLLDTLRRLRIEPDAWPDGPYAGPLRETNTCQVLLGRRAAFYLREPLMYAAIVKSGARFYSVEEFCRLAETGFAQTRPRFPIFHVPHAGDEFPEELRSSACVPEPELRAIHERMRDTDADRLVPWTCQSIRRHAEMDALCERHSRLLLIDLHSYSAQTMPLEWRRADGELPDVCIGADARFTPPPLLLSVKNRCAEAGLRAAVNDPYSGCFVPGAVLRGRADCELAAIMLEFHKRTYCGADGRADEEKVRRVREMIGRVLADCVAE